MTKKYPVGKRENIAHIFSYYFDMARNRMWEAERNGNKQLYEVYAVKVKRAEELYDIVCCSDFMVFASGKDFVDMKNAINCYRLTH